MQQQHGRARSSPAVVNLTFALHGGKMAGNLNGHRTSHFSAVLKGRYVRQV